MSVFKYDVELRLVNKDTREQREARRTEWAYNVGEACMQAAMNTTAELLDSDTWDVSLVHIGPASEFIERATADLRKMVDALVRRTVEEIKCEQST